MSDILRALELIYKNSSSQEELECSLEYHNISIEDLLATAKIHGWEPGPVVMRYLPGIGNSEVNTDYIEKSNKSTIRRLSNLLDHAIAKLEKDVHTNGELTTVYISDTLESLIKNKEKLTKIELPLYGITSLEPPAPVNPIHIHAASPDEKVPGKEEYDDFLREKVAAGEMDESVLDELDGEANNE